MMRRRQNYAEKQVLKLNIAYDQSSLTLEELLISHGMPPAWSLNFSISRVAESGGGDEVGGLGWHKETFEGKVDSNIMTLKFWRYFLSTFTWTLGKQKRSWGQMYGNTSPPLSLVTLPYDCLPQPHLAHDDMHTPVSFHWRAACLSWRRRAVMDIGFL